MGQNEVRREVVGEYKTGGVTLRELERKYGVSSSTIHRWVKQAEPVGGIEDWVNGIPKQELLEKSFENFREAQATIDEAVDIYNNLRPHSRSKC